MGLSLATNTYNLRALTAEGNLTQNNLPRAAGVALGAKDKAPGYHSTAILRPLLPYHPR